MNCFKIERDGSLLDCYESIRRQVEADMQSGDHYSPALTQPLHMHW